MPRPASDRAFGFRKEGIIRILIRSDITEVADALNELGLSADPGFFEKLTGLFDDLFGPLFAFRELVSDTLDLIFGPIGGVSVAASDVERLEEALASSVADATTLLAHFAAVSHRQGRLLLDIADALVSDLRLAQRILADAGGNLSEATNAGQILKERLDDEDARQDQAAVDFRQGLEEGAPKPPTTTII